MTTTKHRRRGEGPPDRHGVIIAYIREIGIVVVGVLTPAVTLVVAWRAQR